MTPPARPSPPAQRADLSDDEQWRILSEKSVSAAFNALLLEAGVSRYTGVSVHVFLAVIRAVARESSI